MYVAHKYGYQNVKESLMALTQFLDVQDLQAKTVVEMLSSDWKDYEDATQNQTALLSICCLMLIVLLLVIKKISVCHLCLYIQQTNCLLSLNSRNSVACMWYL